MDAAILQNIFIITNKVQGMKRERLCPLKLYSEQKFYKLFRLHKVNAKKLLRILLPDLQMQTGRNDSLSHMMQLCLALRFYATGDVQLSVASTFRVSQSIACRTIWKVTCAINRRLSYLISFTGLPTIKNEFFEMSLIPIVIGCIDYSHIRIPTPAEYINCKGYHSVNVQAVCDRRCIFHNVVAEWSGSVHDSRIFRSSELYVKLFS
jgi:nuclease HARBI1